MSLALLDEILLREKTDPVLTAKGSELTFDEEDTNFVIIHDAIKELSEVEVGGISAYNAGTTYSLTTPPTYVTYNNNTWEYIKVTPSSGTTPGTDATVWSLASNGVFSHQQNTDTYLAQGTANECSASDLRALLDAGGAITFDSTPTNGSTNAVTSDGIFDALALKVTLAGSETITGQKTLSLDTIHADTKGITWASGSSLKDNAGALEITGFNSTVFKNSDVYFDEDIIFNNDGAGFVWNAGGSELRENSGTLELNGSAMHTVMSGTYIIEASATTLTTSGAINIGTASTTAVNLGRSGQTTSVKGVFNLDALTASTLPIIDGSKNLVSLANASGFLKNNGSGTLSYDNTVLVSGGALGTPSSGTLTNCTGLPSSGITGYQGYVIMPLPGQLNPADATTYYFGALSNAVSTTANDSALIIPKTGTIKRIDIVIANGGTLGSNEASTVYFRLNNTTDTVISNSVTTNAVRSAFTNSGLSVAVAAGDTYEIKWVAPTYATNPTSIRFYVSIYIE
jgi:hypothetical protein